MNTINAENLNFRELNEKIKKSTDEDITIENCLGHRFIGSGLDKKNITVKGISGNALGAYLNGATITLTANAQDAVGDTMNDGKIIIHGNAGDALGYSMRGGSIYVRGNAGYRTGIHMKEYKNKKPIIIIGGKVGSFLGEYLAGGIIIILGINQNNPLIGNFTGTGMHGGKIYIRTPNEPKNLPNQVIATPATQEDLHEITENLKEYTNTFTLNFNDIINSKFYVLKPNAKNPYKKLYVTN